MEASHKTHRPHIKVGKDEEEEGEFSLRFTAPLSGRSLSKRLISHYGYNRGRRCPRQAAHFITAKIGDAGVPRHVK